jgi:hypothetical protein
MYCDIRSESRNKSLLGNGSVITFCGNGSAGKSQSVATELAHVSWQHCNTRTVEIVIALRFALSSKESS